jgi:3-deoxy-manno-octulosonate cytidylyltransferase (CMP-KDO synthetase)
MKRVVGAVPARWGSTRLPGKPLLPLLGKPMIQHVVERARAAPSLSRVVVLTDDERIRSAVEGFGGECEMTPADCRSGTDRIAWAARSWDDVSAVVNVQGDEPLIDPGALEEVASHLVSHPDDAMVTLSSPAEPDEVDDPNAVKVVVDARGYALYFSRASIPHRRHDADPRAAVAPRKHVGVYGYQLATLFHLAELEPSPLERTESLEQLRALENGIPIRVLPAARAAAGVDTAADLARAEARLRRPTPPLSPSDSAST